MASNCSFCGASDYETVRRISRASLLTEYKSMYNLSFPPDVLESNFDFATLDIKKCRRCGTVYFDPMIAGDATYYRYLSRNVSWYYSAKRWEYPIVSEILTNENPKLFLEMGCGAGHFLRLARSRGYEGHGCEFNPQFIETLRKDGFHIITELSGNETRYDALFMFQVLEHLKDPYSFLASLLPNIRPGGVAVLSTPVRPSCAAVSANPFLQPPHHLWLPTVSAFRFLAERLGLVCETIMCDPPDSSQIVYAMRKWFRYAPYSNHFARYWTRAGNWVLKLATGMHCDWAKVGHTGMAVLRKPL